MPPEASYNICLIPAFGWQSTLKFVSTEVLSSYEGPFVQLANEPKSHVLLTISTKVEGVG